MIDLVQLSSGVFGVCARLFPAEFRRDYGEELQGVFTTRLKEAMRREGAPSLLKFCWREFRDLPPNILKEHWASLRKKLGADLVPGSVSPWRAAWMGGLGFAIGTAFLIVFRGVTDPGNDLLFRNYNLGLLRETMLFGVIGGIGWWLLGRMLFPPAMAGRLVWRGIGFGALGGLVATLLISSYYLYVIGPNSTSRIPIQFLGSLFVGAGFGAPIVFEAGFRKHSLRLLLTAIVCFSIGFLASNAAFSIYWSSPVAFDWRMQHWAIPLALAGAIGGWVEGALWGWMVWLQRPREPDVEAAGGSIRSSVSGTQDRRSLISPSGFGRIRSNYLILRRYP